MYQKSERASTLDDFTVVERIGEGSYSKVFKVVRKMDGHIYAMKKVEMRQLKQKEKENALNEVRLIASFDDPFIVSFKDVFVDEASQVLCIVMEFATGGDLQRRIQTASKSSSYIAEPEIWRALYHITRGLKRLHESNIIHRDLKCANIFISDSRYKLGDLNVSKVAKQGLVQTQTGTPYYASPEVWKDQPYGIKSDIWSLGCVIYEMAALKPPFRAADMQGLFRKVQSGIYDPIPRMYSQELKQVISLLLKVDPYRRPTCAQLLNNPMLIRNAGGQEAEGLASKVELLETIYFPKNFVSLKAKLPKSKYNNEDEMNRSMELRNPQQKAQVRALSALPVLSKYDQYPNAPYYNNTPQVPKTDKNSSSAKQLAPLNRKVDPQQQPQSLPSSASQKQQKQSDVFRKEEKNVRQEQLKLLEQKKAEQQKLLEPQQRTSKPALPQIQEQASGRRDSDPPKKPDQHKQQDLTRQSDLPKQPDVPKQAEQPKHLDVARQGDLTRHVTQPSLTSHEKDNHFQSVHSEQCLQIQKKGDSESQKHLALAPEVIAVKQQAQSYQSLPQRPVDVRREEVVRQCEVPRSDVKVQEVKQVDCGRVSNGGFEKLEQQVLEQYTEQVQQMASKSRVAEGQEEAELVLSGLKNLNPQSINSILCQPVLKANESPFPVQAKVMRQKKKEPKQQALDDQAIKVSRQQLEKVFPNGMPDPKRGQPAPQAPQHQRASRSQRPESAQLEVQESRKKQQQQQQHVEDNYYNIVRKKEEERGSLPQVKGRSGGNGVVSPSSQQAMGPQRQQSAKLQVNLPH